MHIITIGPTHLCLQHSHQKNHSYFLAYDDDDDDDDDDDINDLWYMWISSFSGSGWSGLWNTSGTYNIKYSSIQINMPNYAEEEAWSVGNWKAGGGSNNHKNTVTKQN